MPQIYFFSVNATRPTGGVFTIFSHAEALRALGFEASVVCADRSRRPSWVRSDVPILYADENILVRREDVLVMPEVYDTQDPVWRTQATKVLFCQNHFHMLHGLRGTPSWTDLGCRHALACSRVIAEALRRCFSFDDVSVIRCAVDRTLFRPRPKRLQICCIGSKMPEEANLIHGFFQRLYPEYAGVPWVGLRNAERAAVAEAMGHSALFLSLSRREGLGLPPLEAMAAGCLVTGFHGVGGREYATPENGLWCGEEDLFGCAVQLGQALRIAEQGGVPLQAYLDEGLRTVERFSEDGMRRDLQRYWSGMMAR